MTKVKIRNSWADTLNPDKHIKIKFAIQLGLHSLGLGCDWEIDVVQTCQAHAVNEPHEYEVKAKRVISIGYDNNEFRSKEIADYQHMSFEFRAENCAVVDIYEGVVKAHKEGSLLES